MKGFLEWVQTLDTNRKVALAVLGPLMVLGIYYFVLLSPRTTRTSELRKHIETLEDERAKKITEANSVGDRQKDVAELDKRLKTALTRLPDEKEIPNLLSSVSDLGRESGLEILVFRQKPEEYADFYAQVPVEMQVRGTYHQVARFLNKVGKLDRIVNVNNIVMKEPKVFAGEMVVNASSQVTTYRFLSEAERERLIKDKKIQPKPTPAPKASAAAGDSK